jgi:hypothetical protein
MAISSSEQGTKEGGSPGEDHLRPAKECEHVKRRPPAGLGQERLDGLTPVFFLVATPEHWSDVF